MSMIPSISQERPPFVRFEERQGPRDVERSNAAGYPIHRTIIMACITPHGSKDVVEKEAEDWLAQIKLRAASGGFNPDWVRYFREQFEAWKLGNELPREGTPVKTWQMVTKDQANRLIAVGYLVVEDLAQLPDSGLNEIGLDGRYLRDLARNWVNEGKEKGVTAIKLADANTKIEELQQRCDALLRRLEQVETKDEGGEKRGPGRPRKSEAA